MRQLHAGDRVRIRDERWRVSRVAPYGAAAVVEVRGCGASNRGERASFLLPHETVDHLPRWLAPRVVRPRRWRHAARRALSGVAVSWTSLHAVTRATLDILPFQLEPALALVRGSGSRFLIADAVGMGKTVQHVAASPPMADAVRLHGGLTPRERADVLDRFVRGSARLLLATDAASEGLNLHHRCRLVINLELPWTPLRLEQRAGRIDRIGQQRRVHAVHLIAADTSEEHVLAKLAARLSRTDNALSTLGRLPGEREVAECVLANGALPDAVPRSASPDVDGMQVPDLRHEANQEAARIVAARALLEPCDDAADGRPVLTRLRTRRVGPPGPRCYWLFRLLLAASDGRIAATGCIALGTYGIPWLPRSNAATRLLLDPGNPAVRELAASAAAALAVALTGAGRAHFRLRIDRERALARELRDRQARLSSHLLQPGLFDHRHERTAAAQASLLEGALAASALRIAQLAAAETLRVDACELLFAVVLE